MKETIKKVIYENLDSVVGVSLLFLFVILGNINSISSLYVYGLIILPIIAVILIQKLILKTKKKTKNKRFRKEKSK